LKEGKLTEALPKFKTPYEAYSWIMNKRGEAMDIETEMLNISGEIHDKYKDMEQEAEAGGGPVADRYGKEIEALENKHKELRKQFAAVMAEIDEYDQNY
jgi:chromosome segregation ATPase